MKITKLCIGMSLEKFG